MTDDPQAGSAPHELIARVEYFRAESQKEDGMYIPEQVLVHMTALADALEAALADTRRIDRLTEALDIVHSPQLRDAYGASISVVLTLANSVPEPTVRQLLDMAWGEP